MAQSNSFFGQRKGSTKSLTFQRRSGVQITQDRKVHIRDAKSVGQAQHRCLLHTTVDACTWLAPIFNFAWQNAKGKEAYQSAFRKANYDIIRSAALGSMAGFTYSKYQQKSAPVGYFQVAGGSLPYHGNFFKNGINGIDYTECDFLNYTAEGMQWYQVLSNAGLKVGDSLLLVILFRNPVTGTITHDVARVHINDVPDVVIGQQAANSLVSVEWLRNVHNWQVLNNSIRVLSLRCQHTDFDPSGQIMFTAAFQYEQRQGRMFSSQGILWHWGDNVDGFSYDEAIVTYPMAEDYQPILHPVPEELWVDMGLPSGLLWATRNIDVTQKNGFALSPYQYECSFFSWGNIDGHNPISPTAFDYDFGNSNEGPYASTPGAALTGDIDSKHDAATQNCGAPWRMPSSAEFQELIANVDFIDAAGNVIGDGVADKRTTVNGVLGLRMKSKLNRKILFIPSSGYGEGMLWNSRGSNGYNWSSSLYLAAYGHRLLFNSSGVYPSNYDYRFHSFAIRPVREPSRKKSSPEEK